MTTLEMMTEAKANPGVGYCSMPRENQQPGWTVYAMYSDLIDGWAVSWDKAFVHAATLPDCSGWRRAE